MDNYGLSQTDANVNNTGQDVAFVTVVKHVGTDLASIAGGKPAPNFGVNLLKLPRCTWWLWRSWNAQDGIK